MHVKVPDVNKCCFCIPLRHGILIFAYLNFLGTHLLLQVIGIYAIVLHADEMQIDLFSILAVSSLVIMTELKRVSITNNSSLEIMTCTVLFSILGMAVILNLLLIIAGHQKDVSMLRLYNYYTVATLLAAMVPTFILLSLRMYIEVISALITLVMQFYVIVLVRSEVVKLERMKINEAVDQPRTYTETTVAIPDTVTLL